MSQLETLCPTGMLICDIITGQAASRSNNSPRILLCGDDDSHTRHLGPALLHTLEHLPCHVLDVTTLFEETGRATEESIIQKMKMARRSLPSMLYIPDILAWWDLVDEAARVVFTSLMHGLDRSVYMLILTTANCSREDLPADIACLFEAYQGEVFEVVPPGEKERESFFKQLFVHSVSDIESNRSSQEDLVPVANTKKIKEVGRRRKHAGRTDNGENSAAQVNVKRRNSPVGDGPPSKRTRNSPANNMSVSSKEKLNDSETEDLLQKIVEMTHMWPSRDLESIYASLELTLERTEEDICSATIDCLEQFKQLRRMKLHVKKEEAED